MAGFQHEGGWTYDFISEVDHDSMCPTCGHQFCKTCIGRVSSGNRKLPSDNEVISQEQEQKHLDGCENKPIECTRKDCKILIPRERVIIHVDHECLLRPIKCQYCGGEVVFCDKDEHLKDSCLEFSIPCENGCGLIKERKAIEAHLEKCPHRLIECTYAAFGCNEKIVAKDMDAHLNANVNYHMDRMAFQICKDKEEIKHLTETVKNNKTEIDQLTEENRLYLVALFGSNSIHHRKFNHLLAENMELEPGFVEHIWIVDDFKMHWEASKERWEVGKDIYSVISPGYTTGARGYQFLLNMYPSGLHSGRGTHISICFRIIKGQWDDVLVWPSALRMQLTLINIDKSKNISKSDSGSDAFIFPKPNESESLIQGIIPYFVDHKMLFEPGFVISDKIFIKIRVPRFSR